MKENEQVSFEQNQHIPTSLFEPLLQAMIPPLQWSSLVYIQIIFAPFTMEDLFSKSSTFIQERPSKIYPLYNGSHTRKTKQDIPPL